MGAAVCRRASSLPQLDTRYGVVFSRFSPSAVWWGDMLLLRKATIMLAMAFLSSSPVFQSVVLLLVLEISLLAHVTTRPCVGQKNGEEGHTNTS